MRKDIKKTTVLIVDDHPLFRDGIVNLLQRESDFEVVGQAVDGEEAIRLVDEKSPDIVLIDIEMPNVDGVAATRRIKTTHPASSVIALTIHDDEEYIAALLNAGATGYLLKTTYGKELVQAIRSAHLGEFVLDDQIGPKVFRAFTMRSNKAVTLKEKLSDKEMELMKLVASGKTNEEIFKLLGISLGAVKEHLSSIYSKLGVNSRTGAVTACLRLGIISLDECITMEHKEAISYTERTGRSYY
jgi:DNA-binding NarL/FixJ family response regulator